MADVGDPADLFEVSVTACGRSFSLEGPGVDRQQTPLGCSAKNSDTNSIISSPKYNEMNS